MKPHRCPTCGHLHYPADKGTPAASAALARGREHAATMRAEKARKRAEREAANAEATRREVEAHARLELQVKAWLHFFWPMWDAASSEERRAIFARHGDGGEYPTDRDDDFETPILVDIRKHEWAGLRFRVPA